MATRPIFVSQPNTHPYVVVHELDFKWYPGFAKVQAQRSIQSLHEAARLKGWHPLLEISSKSEDRLGVALSAFNLFLIHNEINLSVECAFQGSKVFELGGPYQDLYKVSSRDARTDSRIRESGELIGFQFFDIDFPILPVTAFYDWLYISALDQNKELADQLSQYSGFTDIAFNPKRSWNCQARSAALCVGLQQSGLLDDALRSVDDYLRIVSDKPGEELHQGMLPLDLE